MDIFSGTKLSAMAAERPKLFQELLPELIKKLILCNSNNVKNIRMPSKDDNWSPGFDGIVESEESTVYVCAGKSVWEIGTNRNSLKKINKDWEKRNQNPLGMVKEETTIYFVFPHVWAYDNQGWSISKWETEHQQEWKGIHIYDANVLSDWINSEPAVCAWLLEQFGETGDIDFLTASSAWERFSSKSSPAFSHSLFLEGRDVEAKNFLETLDSSIIRVKADTTIDSFGFCLSVILKNEDLANTVIVINNQTTYKNLSRFCHDKLFLLNCQLNADDDVIPGNRVILCYNKEARTIRANIELRQLTKSYFDRAIKDMSVPELKAIDLYGSTHGNLLSLIRKLPGNTTMSAPQWATFDRIILLAPVLLLRDFDTQNKSDCDLVSYLAGEKYEVVSEKYDEWLRLEDSPIKRVDDHIVLINFEEAWQVLNLSTNNPIFSRFTEVLCTIISNPYLEENSPSYVDGRTPRHLYNLLSDLIYFSYDEGEKECIEQSVARILTIEPFPALAFEHLALLSEAAPQIIMDFFEKDIINPDGVVNSAFKEDIYSQNYCKVLFALDELVLHDDTRIHACDFLFDLCLKTQNSKFVMSNSPRESLLTALCLWNDHTVLTVDDKVKLIKRYFSTDEVYSLSFVVDLILKNTISRGVRTGAKQLPRMPIYTNELFKAINDLALITFDKSIEHHDIGCLKKLLEEYYHFSLDTLQSAAKLFAKAEYTPEELVSLNSRLREQAFYAMKSEETKPWLPALEVWVNVTTPSDSIGQVGWLFHDFYHCHSPEIAECDDWEGNPKPIESKRVEVINALAQEHSEKLNALVRYSNDDASWGSFYARVLSSAMLLNFVYEARRLQKNRILYGLLDGAKREDCITILDTFSLEEQTFALQNMYRKDIEGWLNTEEKEKAYWSHQIMCEYDANIYSKLLSYNPCELLVYYSYRHEASLCIEIDKIIEIINAILSLGAVPPNNLYLYGMEKLLSRIDEEGYYSEEWAKLCVTLYEQDWLQTYPNALKRYYFENPHLLCEAEVHLTGKTYSHFHLHYELPLIAYDDPKAFHFFVKTIVDNHTDKDMLLPMLGSILGKAPNGSDGIFPHEVVRNVLESYREYRLNHHVLIGKLNSRGFRSVEDGAYEINCSKKLREDAKLLEVTYPETAQLLRWLSDDYAAAGKRDHLFSEIGTSAW